MSMLLSIRVIKLFNDDQEAVVDIRSLHIAFFLYVSMNSSMTSVAFLNNVGFV